MANISNLNTTTTDAVFVPEQWSPLVLRAATDTFVAAKLFERREKDLAKKGDKIHFPISSIMTATAFTQGNKLEDLLSAATENEKTIIIDKNYVAPFLISNELDEVSAYNQMAEEMWGAGQAIAKRIDTDILADCANYTNSAVGTAGVAVTNLTLTAAKQALDIANVPMEDRFWMFDPRTEKDLLDLTGNYFTSMDFAGNKPMVNGNVNRMVLGSPVYLTNNLPTASTGSPATTYRKNIYAHKQATGVALLKDMVVEKDYSLNFQGWMGNVRTLYGVGNLRPTFGVVVNGR